MKSMLKTFAVGAAVVAALWVGGVPLAAQAGQPNCAAPRIARLPGQNIVTAAVAAGQFNTLVGVLGSTGLDKVLAGPGPFTVFAPTDAAFAKIPAPILGAVVSDNKVLPAVLTYHVVAGNKDLRFLDKIRALKSVQGEKVFASVACRNGAAVLRINNSTVVARPIAVDNGIIYVLDSVLLPQF